jgi:sec-independent protein translocase protein TatA
MIENLPIGFLQNMGTGEWIVALAVALLLFGSKKLPQLARSIGKSVNEFKNGLSEVKDKIQDEPTDEDKKSQ